MNKNNIDTIKYSIQDIKSFVSSNWTNQEVLPLDILGTWERSEGFKDVCFSNSHKQHIDILTYGHPGLRFKVPITSIIRLMNIHYKQEGDVKKKENDDY